MNSFGHRGPRARRRFATAAVACVAAAVLAACTSGTTANGPAESKIKLPKRAALSATNQAAILKSAFLTSDVKAESLHPLIVRGLEDAGATYSNAQIATAQGCLAQTECKIGKGKLTIAILDGSGADLWRHITRAAITLQATSYPEIGTVIYQDAGGQLATMQAQLQSMVTRGVDGIVVYDDFGPAMTSAFASAKAQGIPIVAYGGTPGAGAKDAVLSQTASDFCDDGNRMAQAAKEMLGAKGKVAFFTGTPGNPQGAGWQKCAQAWFAANAPGITVANKSNTDWSQQGTRAAASALISSGQKIDAILYDYSKETVTIAEAYKQAKRAIPNQISWTTDNTLLGMWEKDQGGTAPWKLAYTTSINWEGNIALTALAAHLAGEKVPPQLTFPLPFVQAQKGAFDPSQPPNAPGEMLLPAPLLNHLLRS
jgi:ABC-type sugar transport system substrate-binding protein